MSHSVSIILATHNRAHFIPETLKSLQAQTYGDFECLIIDDGGTKDTVRVLKPFLNDVRFKYLTRPNTYPKGLPGSRNYGLDLAKGDYMLFCDDDDIMHPENLEICLSHLNGSKIDFLHFQKQAFVELPTIKELKPNVKAVEKNLDFSQLPLILGNQIGLASCTVMWSRAAIGSNRFVDSLKYAEELEFYTRLLLQDLKGSMIDTILYYNRKHPNSNTGHYFNGDSHMKRSFVEANKLIIDLLDQKRMLNNRYVKLLSHKAATLKSRELLLHLIKKIKGSPLKSFIAVSSFHLQPVVGRLMIFKKKLRAIRS